MNNFFCNTQEYSIKIIPKNLNYFQKQKWIKDHVELITNDNTLIYLEKNYIGWVEIFDEAKYWMPYEKLNYFINLYNILEKNFIIAEQQDYDVLYYVVIDGFLFFYSSDYEKSIKVFEKNNILSYKSIGIGCVDMDCDVLYGYQKSQEKNHSVMESTSSYNMQDNEFYNKPNDYVNNNSGFFKWFNAQKTNQKKEKIKLTCMIFGCFFLFILNVALYNINQVFYEELLCMIQND